MDRIHDLADLDQRAWAHYGIVFMGVLFGQIPEVSVLSVAYGFYPWETELRPSSQVVALATAELKRRKALEM